MLIDARRQQSMTLVVVAMIASVALSACSSTPASSSAASAQASFAAGASPAVTPAPVATTAPSKALPSVDLVFTGTLNFSAKGTAGQCPGFAPGAPRFFSFSATEADYPGLGQSFSLGQFANSDYVDLKWVVDATTLYARGSTSPVIVLSADKTSIRIDGALAGPATNGPESVSGTITCP